MDMEGSVGVKEGQRLDDWYYFVARRGYDCSTGERDEANLQRYAAKRSRMTRKRLFEIVGGNDEDHG